MLCLWLLQPRQKKQSRKRSRGVIKLKLLRELRQESYCAGPFIFTPTMAWRDSEVFEDGKQGPFMAYHDLTLTIGGRYVTVKGEKSLANLSENKHGEREAIFAGRAPRTVWVCAWGECLGHEMSRADFIKRYCGGKLPPLLEPDTANGLTGLSDVGWEYKLTEHKRRMLPDRGDR